MILRCPSCILFPCTWGAGRNPLWGMGGCKLRLSKIGDGDGEIKILKFWWYMFIGFTNLALHIPIISNMVMGADRFWTCTCQRFNPAMDNGFVLKWIYWYTPKFCYFISCFLLKAFFEGPDAKFWMGRSGCDHLPPSRYTPASLTLPPKMVPWKIVVLCWKWQCFGIYDQIYGLQCV